MLDIKHFVIDNVAEVCILVGGGANSMKGHREPLKQAAEYDVVCARHVYCYLVNSTAAHKIKKQMSRRNRRASKQNIMEEVER